MKPQLSSPEIRREILVFVAFKERKSQVAIENTNKCVIL